MYDIEPGATKVGYATTDASPAQKPITLQIIDQQSSSLDIARETRARLYSLRDRLFGPQPPNANGSQAVQSEPNCFADVARSNGFALRDILNEIDSVSSEISNRL